ncbi:MAG: PAS domain S-box protein [Verrucomicrobia bacterium]|nr:PAS domain S-box protein [Verrucomicrobiota bacterium]
MILRRKIFLRLSILLLLLIGAIVGSLMGFVIREHRTESKRANLTLCSTLAAGIERDILWDDRVAVRRELMREIGAHPHFEYLFVVCDGQPYVSTFSNTVPPALLQLPKPGLENTFVREFVNPDGAVYYDVQVPVGRAGALLRLGVKRHAIDQQIQPVLSMMLLIGLLTFLVGLFVASRIAWRTTAEVTLLCNAIRSYGVPGEAGLSGPTVDSTADVAELAEAFHNLVADHKQAEMVLREREAALSEAQRLAHIGSWALDISTGSLMWSDEIYRIFNLDPGSFEPTYEFFLSAVHPNDRELVDAAYAESLKNKTRYEVVHRLLLSDGSVKHVREQGKTDYNEDGTPLKSIGTIQDITERKRVAEQMERLMAAINQVAEVVLITDVKGAIQYVNPAFEKVTGYSREEALGQNPRILKSGEQDAAFYKKLWATLLRGETWSGLFVNRKKGGTFYTEEAMISPVKDADGQIVNFVAVKRDVTSELKIEEQLRQSQKMESIGQLVGGVAHDFNNLLQIINGYADITRASLEPGHAAIASIEEVSKAGLRAKDLVKQLLAFSRQQVIDPKELDLNKEIETSREIFGHLLGENIRIKFVAGKDLGMVFSDRGQIHQMLINLCVNARDAMPGGGALTLKTENVLIAPEDLKACGLTRPGRYVLLSVADTGCGMDKQTCEKIFDPFFTTKEVGKGTGLGLSTVYGIVKQNEGHIAVCSEPGQGAVFKIYLPVSQPIPAGIINSIIKNDASAEGGLETILVVEDDALVLKLATLILSGAGYTVVTAKDGVEAVRVFEERADEIDLVMMDVVMPRMGGKEAMGKILKKRPALRHLFTSGYSPGAGHNDFIKEKSLHLMSKPYQAEALLQKIREVLDEDRKTEA